MVLPERWEDTELVRYEAGPEPVWALALLAVLALGLFGLGVVFGAGILGLVDLAPTYMGIIMSLQFFDMALIGIVYYKYFLPHMLIARDEHPDDVLW